MKIRTYSEISKLKTMEERYEYLKLTGEAGAETFGYERYLNQNLYRSKRWKEVRNKVIVRDNGCDMGIEDFPIPGKVIIHHMNPLTLEDIQEMKDEIFDPEFLICVSHSTHNAIHYGDINQIPKGPAVRRPNDTIPWLSKE